LKQLSEYFGVFQLSGSGKENQKLEVTYAFTFVLGLAGTGLIFTGIQERGTAG